MTGEPVEAGARARRSARRVGRVRRPNGSHSRGLVGRGETARRQRRACGGATGRAARMWRQGRRWCGWAGAPGQELSRPTGHQVAGGRVRCPSRGGVRPRGGATWCS